MIHGDRIERYPGTLVGLAGELGDLRYDALEDFLRALATKLEIDAAADAGRGRSRLAAVLQGSSAKITAAADEIGRAWSICAPRM